MLHLVQSNKMEMLADSLIDCLSQQHRSPESLFVPDTILVQSPGMSQWLKIQIAQKRGIAANVEFPLPSSFIWELYRQNIKHLPEQSAFTKPNMTWKLMSLLPSMLHHTEFSSIANYLANAPLLKQYQLAHKIADIYDQYLVYRPEWILAWEAADTVDGLGQTEHPKQEYAGPDETLHPWQGILWRAMCRYSVALGESRYHRANLHQQLLSTLSAQAPDGDQQKPLFVFGLSAMPQQQLEVLDALAVNRDVFVFWFNPSQHYWGDIVDGKTMARAHLQQLIKSQGQQSEADYLQSGNPLLASWGKLGRDYQDMLLSFDFVQHDYFVETQPRCMLEHIQAEIFELQFRHSFDSLSPIELLGNGEAFPKTQITTCDRSVQFHACHSRVRELEVLHDQLLDWFAQDERNQPGEVIVMMPDVGAYAPFIEGIFGSAPSQRYIPFGISDRNISEESPLLTSFVQLMKLQQSRLTLSEVMTWLAVPAVMRQFDLNEQEYTLLQHWLADAGVRWGWDDADKKRWELPEQGQNTWLFGLQRLLAGYAMDASQLLHYQQQLLSPYADIEGQQAVALGKFYVFAQQLLKVLDFCQRHASLADKVTESLAIIDALYECDERELVELSQLRKVLEHISKHQSQCEGEIDQAVFVAEVEQQLSEKGVGQRFLAGYVNFCTLMPMRSIPFKKVCLLGMNDADYPRQTVPVGFDLMRVSQAKRGDRSRRLDDRYLFLEALLSAREQLYISYLGTSQKDNTELSPSILVSELLEYCEQGYALDGELHLVPAQTAKNLRQHLITKHSLQPFADDYFIGNTRLPSYNEQAAQVAITRQQKPLLHQFNAHPLPAFYSVQAQRLCFDGIPVDINLEELIQFFMNPTKAFFLQRWQCRFSGLGDELLDDEPFSFDGLDKYQLNERLMAELIQQQQNQHLDRRDISEHFAQQLRAEGRLPVGYSGLIALETIVNSSQALATEMAKQSGGQKARLLPIDLVLNCEYQHQAVHINLQGQVTQIFGPQLILWRSGKLRAKDRLRTYLSWLCICAQAGNDGIERAVFIELEGQKVKSWELQKLSQAEAHTCLSELVGLFIKGQQTLIPFFPESAWQWVASEDKQKVFDTFNGQDGGFIAGEGAEPHIARVYPDLKHVFEDFCQLSEQILLPLQKLSDI
ncbi:exodeoxyribonuclease V subunit gamma [Flavobacterium sp. W21_SRS_FM6]|uniref:exodeoxyribonuclease V subunit gamma n=1 Tax=Flavobacterium sp. W21_SRS_FM6 TaxID=3240268 RepID=UPI003F8F4A4A